MKRLIQRANAAWDRNDYASALVDFEEILSDHPGFPDILNRVGLCRAMMDDAEGALADFDRAVTANPDYAEAHLNRALVLNDLSRFDEAREAFDRARDLDHLPGDPFPADLGNRLAVEHAQLGDLYLQADQPAQAMREYRKALDMRPNFVDIRSRLAQAYLSLDDAERAARELERVLDEHPSFLTARLRLGVTLRRMGRTDEAIEEWRRCLEVDPGNRRAHAYLASCGVRVEQVELEP